VHPHFQTNHVNWFVRGALAEAAENHNKPELSAYKNVIDTLGITLTYLRSGVLKPGATPLQEAIAHEARTVFLPKERL
jgi:hypothetical protein